MQTIAQVKTALLKQLELGIWTCSDDRLTEVQSKIHAIQTQEDINSWREWMYKEFPENLPSEEF